MNTKEFRESYGDEIADYIDERAHWFSLPDAVWLVGAGFVVGFALARIFT